MANIFRRIRQQSFNKNKSIKYVLYAIGEILLVVIGILIALKVNNLNEQSKSNEKEEKYLVSMLNELTNNNELVKIEIEALERSIDGQRKLIELMNTQVDTIQESELSNLLALSFSKVFELKYQDGTLKELLYSGGLITLQSDSIKNQITSWEGRMIDVRKQEKGVYDARERITNFMIEKGIFKVMLDDIGASDHLQINKSKKRNSNRIILESQKFENLVSYHLALNIAQRVYYKNLGVDIKNLLEMIQRELDK